MKFSKTNILNVATFETDVDHIMVELGDNYTVIVGSKGVLVYRDDDLESKQSFQKNVLGLEITDKRE